MPRNIDNEDDLETIVEISDDNPSTEIGASATGDADSGAKQPEDDGNTPDTPEQLAAKEDARVKALKKVASEAEEDPDGERGAMIPKGRFNEVNVRMQKAEAEAAALRELIRAGVVAAPAAAPAQAPVADEPQFDLKAMIRQKNAALASGDDEMADELDEKIQKHNVKVATEAALQQMRETNEQAAARQAQAAMEAVAKDVKVAYPQLDEKSTQANPEAIEFVIFKRDRLIADGIVAHKALARAVENAAKVFGFSADKESAATPAQAAVDKRIEEARTRNARAANSQPPILGGNGERATASARVNVAEMSDEDFRALPEAEKKRLRGDM